MKADEAHSEPGCMLMRKARTHGEERSWCWNRELACGCGMRRGLGRSRTGDSRAAGGRGGRRAPCT